MATSAKNTIEHPTWGTIIVTRNPRARRIIMRARPDAIYITAPSFASRQDIEQALAQCGEKLMQRKQLLQPHIIDAEYQIKSANFAFDIALHDKEKFILRRDGYKATLICPAKTQFANDKVQEWLRKVIKGEMTRAAKALLPKRLRRLAEQHNFKYGRCTLRDVHTRWGSCSSLHNINLSIYLMLLPDELIDYVILHELCHTIEMNHSDRFWALLDKVTAPAKAKQLRARLKEYNTDI